MKGLVQIAGVKDRADAMTIKSAGADRIGFPLRLSVHSEDISDEQAARIIADLHLGESAVLITYLKDADQIRRLCRRIGARKVQLHGELPIEQIERLRSQDSQIFVMKSLIVRGDNPSEPLNLLDHYSPFVNAFITDTYDPSTGACGATGKVHDWDVSRMLVEASIRPVILAGGLNPRNVREAILHVRPAGVDAHTGVEGPDGRKDRMLLDAFVSRAKQAFAAAHGDHEIFASHSENTAAEK